jgi:nucleotide-binding universal stress UspA family protein
MFSKTLVCLDGSKMAEEIVPYVTGPCQALKAEVILLHVLNTRITIPPLQTMHIPSLARYPSSTPAHVSDMGKTETVEPKTGTQIAQLGKAQGEAKRYLNDIARPFRAQGLKIRTLTLEGEPGETIVNYVNSQNISLVALTTHGQGGLSGSLMGKTAQFILKYANCPTLIIKPKGK